MIFGICRKFMKYCNESIKEIIGNQSFKVLEDMYQDSEQIEHISNKYQQIIGYLSNEEDQLTAGRHQSALLLQTVFQSITANSAGRSIA